MKPEQLGICANCLRHDPQYGRCEKYPYKPRDWFDAVFVMSGCVDFKKKPGASSVPPKAKTESEPADIIK